MLDASNYHVSDTFSMLVTLTQRDAGTADHSFRSTSADGLRLTAPSIPGRSPVQVLTEVNVT